MRKTTIKNLIHLIIISIPILLLLIACIFPNKKTENYYNGVETSTSENTSSIYFNQLIQNGNFDTETIWKTENGNTLTYNDNSVTIENDTGGTLYSLYPTINYSYIAYHKYLTVVDVKSSNTEQSIRLSHVLNATEPYSRSSEWVTMTYLAYRTSDFVGPYPRIIVQNATANESFSVRNLMMFDLTQMYGVGNEPTASDFLSLFPLDYYDYNTGELLLVHEVNTTTTINETSNIVYTQDTKQINTNIIKPINDFYELQINNWYRDLLDLIGINYDSNNIIKTYIAYQPLWLMWFFLFELIEMILTAVPRILIRLTNKISGGGEV